MKKTGEKGDLEKVDADDKEQSQRFVEAAVGLESDKSGQSFHKAIKKLADNSDTDTT